MQSVELQTQVDQRLVAAIPALAPLLGRRVQVTAIELEAAGGIPEDTARSQAAETAHTITVEEFLKHRLKRPPGVALVTLEDMEAAIIRGALDGNL